MIIAGFLFLLVGFFFALRRLRRTAPASAVPAELPAEFVVFDLETTGLDASRHEIIEIGAIRVTAAPDAREDFERLVKPRRRIPRKITELTGVTQQMVNRDGQELAEAVNAFLSFAGDLPLVAFNAQFDMAFLRRAASRKPICNQVICALELARRTWPGRSSYKLVNLTADAMPDEPIHRALPDCRRALRVYLEACAMARTTSQLNTVKR